MLLSCLVWRVCCMLCLLLHTKTTELLKFLLSKNSVQFRSVFCKYLQFWFLKKCEAPPVFKTIFLWKTAQLYQVLSYYSRKIVIDFLADRTNGGAYATALRLSVRLSVCLSVCLSVTLCIVAKRCVLEQKLLLRAYRKSYMRSRLVPKWMTLTFV